MLIFIFNLLYLFYDSAFVMKLVLCEDFMQETVNTSPKSNNLVNTALPDSDADNGVDQYFSVMEMSHRGMFLRMQMISTVFLFKHEI